MQFIRMIEETYARPGGRQLKDAPRWPYHTFDSRFRFAADKMWDTIWKVDRVADLIDQARRNVRDLRPPSVPLEELGSHMSALRDIPIYLETLIVYLRILADSVANLTPYLYGQKGKNIARDSFRGQREWFVEKRSDFDSRYGQILQENTQWFDVLAGRPPDYIGLRDAIIHYRGGIQLMYQPTEADQPAKIMASLFSDYKTLTQDLFTLLPRIVRGIFVFLDRFVEHFSMLASKETNSLMINLANPQAILLFQYDGGLPSRWLYPDVTARQPVESDEPAVS